MALPDKKPEKIKRRPRRKIMINPRLLRAAQMFEGKQDVRYYLNGVCLKADNRVCGTNGHILLVGESETDMKLRDDWIIKFERNIPASALVGYLYFVDNKTGYLCYAPRYEIDLYGDKAKHIHFRVVDGKFPEIDNFIKPLETRKVSPIQSIGMSGEYVGIAANALGSKFGMMFSFYDENSVIRIDVSKSESHYFHPDHAPTVYIMPTRL